MLEGVEDQEYYDWKRIQDDGLRSTKLTIFDKEGVNATDVRQGALGDCYLLAALSALAHRRPGLIRKIFHPNSSEKGLYILQLYHNRYKKILDVDDFFPSFFVSYS